MSENKLLTYQKASEADLDYLLWLRRQTMQEHLVASGLETNDKSHLQRILYQFEGAKLILLDGQKIGLLKTAEHPKSIELVQIQLSPEHQGKGLGREVISSVLQDALRKRLPVTLSVLKINPALKLYQRIGFEVMAENSHSYTMGYLN